MANATTAECPICFNEVAKFKLLTCSHHFCEPCLVEMAEGDLVLATTVSKADPDGVTEQNGANSTLAEASPPSNAIVCPKCREVRYNVSIAQLELRGLTLVCAAGL